MTGSKKVVVKLPESILNECSKFISGDNENMSEFIKRALILYIEESKKHRIRDYMKCGYCEMAQLNLELSECGIQFDVNELCNYEVRLSESDCIDDDDSKKRRYVLC